MAQVLQLKSRTYPCRVRWTITLVSKISAKIRNPTVKCTAPACSGTCSESRRADEFPAWFGAIRTVVRRLRNPGKYKSSKCELQCLHRTSFIIIFRRGVRRNITKTGALVKILRVWNSTHHLIRLRHQTSFECFLFRCILSVLLMLKVCNKV